MGVTYMNIFLLLLEIVVVLAAIYLGVRTGGIGLGLWGVVGIAVLVFVFHLPPGSPPVDAVEIILAVIVASAIMQAAGGIDYLVAVAARIIQKNPSGIVYIAPLVAFIFTVGAGTGNIYYSLIPVIYQVAYQNKIRPERPLAVASVASQMGIVASPVSAAMAAMLTLVGPKGMSLPAILILVFPASVIALLVASFVQSRLGKPLEEDEEYQRRLAAGQIKPPNSDILNKNPSDLPSQARWSAWIFLAGVALIMLLSIFPALRPTFSGGVGGSAPLSTTVMIQLVMYTLATVLIVLAKVKPADVLKQSILSSGITAIIALFGLAWLADTFITANNDAIVNALGGLVKVAPWSFAIALFIVAALTTSQSGATRALVPIGIALGIPAQLLVGMWPSVIGIYLFPANGSQLATVGIDETGTTRISKYVLYHSFTIATLIGWIVSVVIACLLTVLFFGV